ncbi:glycosyltransferase family 4 protein [Rhodanobacter sp. DHB23]|uniref:glycosyltransferase family 4 protein n=1 Tax=Rhodanobacter sp. DHB23 TaxID=2775923 RepID=UPI00177AD8FE|nr:glycosyltransferase family 4 protein [Rhodanobacter sp. DHB23]MBD8872854.1 glycosyltransferase family 4 protein [Rhodanobacter sp. DHB23]
MRILFLSDNFPPESNALTARLYEHAQYWIDLGHEVTVVTCAPNFPEGKLFSGYRNRWRQIEVMGGIRVVRVKTYMTENKGFVKRTLDFVSFMVMGTFFALFEREPDVVVATSPQFFCAVGGWLVAALRRKPFVLEIRDLWPESIVAVGAMPRNVLIRLFEVVERFIYWRATAIIAVTQGIHDGICGKGVRKEKVHLIGNGVDLRRYRPMPPDSEIIKKYDLENKFVVGFLGTHGLAYALDMIIDMASALRDRCNIAFVFVGAGIERARIENLAAQRQLSNVRMIPRQPGELMPHMWSVCNLALVPLRKSSFFQMTRPAKIFEAMGMGIPILFSGVPGEASRIVSESGAGVCLAAEDVEAHVAAICKLVDDSPAMSRMRLAASSAATNYSRKSLAEKMALIMTEVQK